MRRSVGERSRGVGGKWRKGVSIVGRGGRVE